MTPVWVWMRRTERSCFELGFEKLIVPEAPVFTEAERDQIQKISRLNELGDADGARAFSIVKEYTRQLELQIERAPADWLWSHRRWKSR